MIEKLLVAGVVLELAVIAKLYFARLHRAYRWFVWFLAADAAQTGLLVSALPNVREYAMIWTLAQPILWVVSVLFLLQIYSLWFAEYPGIAHMARWTVIVACAIAVAAIVLIFPQILHNIVPLSHTIPELLLIGMLFPWFFAALFSLRLPRNVAILVAVFTAFLIVESIYEIFLNEHYLAAVNIAGDITMIGWLFLSRAGEKAQVTLFARRDPTHARQLEEKAIDIDRAVARAANWGNR